MPTISRFFGISIAMFFDDHGPAHFHARHAQGNAKVRIDTLEVIDTASLAASCGSCWPGRSYTRANCARTGVAPVPVNTPQGFAKVSVDPETGTVVWPGGADLAPDTLYERVRTGVWPDKDVAA